jgi:peptidoglycan hydrolase-like protein with peptidoglycan-binding domain
VTTNAQGRIEQDIAPDAQHAILIIKDAQTPITEIRIPIKIGHLDPENKVSGQKARLNNLGYFAGPEDNRSEEENRTLFVSAVEEFQCEHGLTVDGKCGPSTQAKLKQVHGC